MTTTTLPTVMPVEPSNTTKRIATSTTTANAIPRQIAHHVEEHHHHFNSSRTTINPEHMRPPPHHIGRNIVRQDHVSHQNFASSSSSSDKGVGPSQASPVRHQQGSERSHHEE